MRHLVADTVCRPTQCQLRQVPGAQYDSPALVGDTEKIVGAQPGLDVLEGDVVHFFANRIRMADCVQHQPSGVADIDFGEGNPQRTCQLDRVVLSVLPGGESGQRKRQNVAARPALAVHGMGRDDQRACVESNPRTHR